MKFMRMPQNRGILILFQIRKSFVKFVLFFDELMHSSPIFKYYICVIINN